MTDTPARLLLRGALPDMVRWYSPTLLAQGSGTGSISGTIKDSSDAVLPGATVVIKQAETGATRESQ